MTWYANTFASGLSPRGVGGFQTSPLFTDGKVALFVGGPWDIGSFKTSTRDAYLGRMLATVERTAHQGTLRIVATTPGLPEASLSPKQPQ